jgi:prevent-host-death family protein
MAVRKKAATHRPAVKPARRPAAGWKLEDAKARFSEVVRRARSEGPQKVSVRGKDAVVVIAAEELERLLAAPARPPLVDFLEGLFVEGLDLIREPDFGRDFVP